MKNLKRKWRKLSKAERARLAAFIVLAIIFLPFTPMSTLWLLLIAYTIGIDIEMVRYERYMYYRKGAFHEFLAQSHKRESMYETMNESDIQYLKLLNEYTRLRDTHNRMLRRRRKENKQ